MKILITSLSLVHFISVGFAQQPHQKLTEENPGREHYFGDSGDIHGEYAVVMGVHSENPNAWSGGMAYVYKISEDGKWELTRGMYPTVSSNQDRFGQGACAMWGNQVVVGDWMNVNQKCGAAHVFKFDSDTSWHQTAMLKPENEIDVESFGQAVDIYENTAVVGANGATYVFGLTGEGVWKQTQKLNDATTSEGFGSNVAIHGDFIVVGAQWEDVAERENQGVVYVYQKQEDDSWSFLQKLTLETDERQINAEFGNSIAIHSNHILVGAAQKNIGEVGEAGVAYLYSLTRNEFTFEQKLFASDFGFNKYQFGENVAISEGFIVVAEGQSRDHKGSVYIFENIEGVYTETDKIVSPISAYYGNDFGQNGLMLDGNQLFVGAPGDGHCGEELSKCGSAYFYSLEKSEPKANDQPFIPAGNTAAVMDEKMKKFNADSIIFDPINLDDVYVLRNSDTQLWGMFQSGRVLIPMDYEYIDFSGWNHPFTFVKKDGKWGVFYGVFNEGKLTVDCRYDALKIYNNHDYLYVASKRDGKWRWVNWANGNELHEAKDYHQELVVYSNWNPGDYDYLELK